MWWHCICLAQTNTSRMVLSSVIQQQQSAHRSTDHFISCEVHFKLNMIAIWVVTRCSLVQVNRRFRGACCVHRQGAFSSEISVNFYQTTQRNIEENDHLLTHQSKNLKYRLHIKSLLCFQYLHVLTRSKMDDREEIISSVCVLYHGT
jgi:hypothetical protein